MSEDRVIVGPFYLTVGVKLRDIKFVDRGFVDEEIDRIMALYKKEKEREGEL